jgi:hypothetical protein
VKKEKMKPSIDRKGILAFLAITFGITWLIEGALIVAGVRISLLPPLAAQYAMIVAMWVPSLATLIITRYITHEKLAVTHPVFGLSWKPYVATAVLVPLGFMLTYALTWALGLGEPDWQLRSFMNLISSTGADMTGTPAPGVMLPMLFVITIVAAPFINGIAGFGEEWGWRGFLLPRLMPLGKAKAYLLSGVIWGLWHAPMIAIGFNYPGYSVLGILMMVLLTTAIGIYINEISLRYRSAILAGWAHGVINSQAYGIWRMLLFPGVNPLLGGITGLVGIGVLTLMGLGTVLYFNKHPQLQSA